MLEAVKLECVRGQRRLFANISFSIGKAELLRVAGANGSGKTSLLRMLCGLLPPVAGEVRWNGSRIEALKEEYAQQLVYLGHAPAVKDDLSAAENLAFACRIGGKPAAGRDIRAALERLGISEIEKPVGKLSQGQRRRAALARLALSEDLPLWLLDEPFAALDAGAIQIVEGLIAQHVARGAAVVYTSHQDAALDRGARVVRLDAMS
jgi:heme exporter protein A